MIIALAGQKGGSGKSTTAICLAVEAMRRRRRVLLVDADPQATAHTWADVAAEAGFVPPPVVQMHAPDRQLGDRSAYDVVIIDCPGREDDVQRSTFAVADAVLLPCGLTAPDVWALTQSAKVVVAAMALRPALRAHLLIARRHPRARSDEMRAVLGQAGLPVLCTELTERAAYRDALAAGQGVTRYAPDSPAAVEIRDLYTELLGKPRGAGPRK